MKNWAGSAYYMKNTVGRRIPLLDWAIISSEHAEKTTVDCNSLT